ncbi:S8 family serine peptidase [Paludisphaera soli]|uniref:S8 family serine peptidase n=1 Tax=Paludisphaera soli TaxID=2712865 RepID=UPI0013EB0DC1|nr:S8 family serine peptidase [Paludisphaera soli]
MREAEEAGVLFVYAAGNQGRNIDTAEMFGHAKVSEFLSRHSNVLIVGGTGRDGGLAPHMNTGRRVGIAAPCVDVVAPSWDGYERQKGPGTSFAAPIVAAVAATLLSQEPELTPSQVIARLREASVAAPGMEGVIGGGRLDMMRLFRP